MNGRNGKGRKRGDGATKGRVMRLSAANIVLIGRMWRMTLTARHDTLRCSDIEDNSLKKASERNDINNRCPSIPPTLYTINKINL